MLLNLAPCNIHIIGPRKEHFKRKVVLTLFQGESWDGLVGNLGECCWDRSFSYPVDYVHKHRVCDLFLALADNYTEVREISVMYPWMLNIEHPVCYRIVTNGPYHTTDS